MVDSFNHLIDAGFANIQNLLVTIGRKI
jgi:hypothetical protein